MKKYSLVIIIKNISNPHFFVPGDSIVGLCITTAGKGRLIDGCSCITDVFHSHPSEDESVKECEGET